MSGTMDVLYAHQMATGDSFVFPESDSMVCQHEMNRKRTGPEAQMNAISFSEFEASSDFNVMMHVEPKSELRLVMGS